MNKYLKISLFALLITGFAVTLNSCKKDFDAPPAPADPAIVANTTIADLKALHQTAGAYDIINDDLIIEGIVVANDRSGNLYKQIFIEDSTGGLQIALDATSLYGTYPVGRKVFIKCKGLCISDYNNTPQLGVKATVAGLPSFEGIPGSLINKYLVGGSLNNPVAPHVLTFAQLNAAGTGIAKPWLNRYLNTLIQLDNVAFETLNQTYSDTSVYKSTQNRNIKDCPSNGNNTIIIRTSAYANFAGKTVPSGRGSVQSIYTIFNTTKQLLLRDSSDVQFTNPYTCALPPGTLLNEDFETQNVPATAPYNVISVPGWTHYIQSGTTSFFARIFSNNKYAYASCFGTNEANAVTWLITNGVNLNNTATETLTFKTMQGYILSTIPGGTPVQSSLKVLLSTNYTGSGNPTTATWTDITSQVALSPGSTTTNFPATFTNSGNVDLSSYSGTIYVAFRYEGADLSGTANDKTSAWEVDDVRIIGN